MLVFGIIVFSACGGQANQGEDDDSSYYDIITSQDDDSSEIEPINYVTDYVGPYVNSEDSAMTMFLSADKNNGAIVSIESGNTVWSIQGKYNNDTKTIEYSKGIKKTISEDGSEIVEYDDGNGKFIIEENELIKWMDSKENEEIVFKYNSEDHE